MQTTTMDKLLRSTTVTMQTSNNQPDRLSFIARVRVNMYVYGLRGLPKTEFTLYLSRDYTSKVIQFQLPAGEGSYDDRAWNKLFRTRSPDEVAYFLNNIYDRLKEIAFQRGLLCYSGKVYQMPAGL